MMRGWRKDYAPMLERISVGLLRARGGRSPIHSHGLEIPNLACIKWSRRRRPAHPNVGRWTDFWGSDAPDESTGAPPDKKPPVRNTSD